MFERHSLPGGYTSGVPDGARRIWIRHDIYGSPLPGNGIYSRRLMPDSRIKQYDIN
jgi:hypothetical protein